MNENDIFKALADPTRRRIFDKLAAGGMNASALREGMPIGQSAMSQHLAVLRNAGLVQERRQGRFVNYQVDPRGWRKSPNGWRNTAPIGQSASRRCKPCCRSWINEKGR